MASDINATLNQLESRVSTLEAKALSATTGLPDILYDDETEEQTLVDRLDWTVSNGWEPYGTFSPIVFDETDPGYPGGLLSSPYGRPEAYQIGRMCLLTGMARWSGSTMSDTLSAGIRHNIRMFGLPTDLRPLTNVVLPCLAGNGDPAALGVVGTAWIEIRPEGETLQPSAQVYYVAGTAALNAGTGWVALQGIFTCASAPIGGDSPRDGGWNDAHFMTTWDTVHPDATWDTYSSVD
jgi:hypothetical protein